MSDDDGMEGWINRIKQNQPQQSGQEFNVSSKEYREYKEEERIEAQLNWYEKLNGWAGKLFEVEFFDDIEPDMEDAIRFMDWRINIEAIIPQSIILSVLAFLFLSPLFFVGAPGIFQIMAIVVPIGVFVYTMYYPILTAKQKVLRSSGQIILAVLYMVIYMRSSPNLEGAVRFVAQNLEGEVANDFNRMLWGVNTGRYTNIPEALEDYADKWLPYNKDFVETLNIMKAALKETSSERRNQLFAEAIENLLDATKQKMKEYSRGLKMPVMAIQGLGILLPVLVMILFPLISAFVGIPGVETYLFAGYNIILPVIVYFIARQVMLSRPPTTATQLMDSDTLPPTGKYPIEIGDREIYVPLLPISLLILVTLAYWPMQHYLGIIFGSVELSSNPGTLAIFRSLMLNMSVAFSAGFYLVFGYKKRVETIAEIEQMESEFPQALYVLGDALRRGTPIEIGIDNAIKNAPNLEITDMFRMISHNIKTMGMTFSQAIFDEDHGVIHRYPSNMIKSIMQAIRGSAGKGTEIVSSAMKTISNYLKQVEETQRKIEDLMSETLSTMLFMAYVLAPVVSGIAVGMGIVITRAFAAIGDTFEDTSDQLDGGGGEAGAGGGTGSGVGGVGGSNISPIEAFDLNQAVPPEIIQLIVGFYFIQLAFLLGWLYTGIAEGTASGAKRNIQIGKILIVGTIFYAITVVALTAIFGGIISSIT